MLKPKGKWTKRIINGRSDFLMSYFDGIEFICFGDYATNTGYFKERNFHDYFGIQYNHAGICRLQKDDPPEQLLDGGCGFFTAPGFKYSYGVRPGETRHHCFICFRGERVDSFISGGLLNLKEQPVFKVRNAEKFYRSMLDLQNLLRYPTGFRNSLRIHLLEGILLQISESPSSISSLNPTLLGCIDTLRKKIVENPQLEWDFVKEVKKISVSYPHFRKLFRQSIGMAPTHFLIECRLNMASRILLSDNRPINEVAGACGYQDEFYFSRLFRKYRFCTASEYRKKHGG